jgi:integrase
VIRSLVDAYERHGLPWSLKIRLPRADRHQKRRLTAGPAWEHYQAIRAAAAAQWQPKAARDVAILGLIASLRVRASEVCRLRVENYTPPQIVLVTKGHRDSTVLEVPIERQREIDAYLALRGPITSNAPLFAPCDLGARGNGMLTRGGLYQMVRELARVAGVPGTVSPHRLLHSITTRLLETRKLPQSDVQKWGRWEDADTVTAYTDSIKRVAAKTAEIASDEIGPAVLPKKTT